MNQTSEKLTSKLYGAYQEVLAIQMRIIRSETNDEIDELSKQLTASSLRRDAAWRAWLNSTIGDDNE